MWVRIPLSLLSSPSVSVKSPHTEDLSPCSPNNTSITHLKNSFEAVRATFGAVFRSHLPQTDVRADNIWCLTNSCMFKPLCVIEAGKAQEQECDHVIKSTKAAEAIEMCTYCLFSHRAALILGILRGTLWFCCVRLKSLQNALSLNWTVDICWNEQRFEVGHCFSLDIIVFLLPSIPRSQSLEPNMVKERYAFLTPTPNKICLYTQ